MRAPDIGMVPLGYGRGVRADEIVALVPIEDGRGSGRRTYVHVAGLAAPIVASRSGEAILGDMKTASRTFTEEPRQTARAARGRLASSSKPQGLRRPTRLTGAKRSAGGQSVRVTQPL